MICKRANEQRLELVKTYREVYGKDLKKELHGELSGNFRDVILGLCLSPTEFDAEQLRKAMKVGCGIVWGKDWLVGCDDASLKNHPDTLSSLSLSH